MSLSYSFVMIKKSSGQKSKSHEKPTQRREEIECCMAWNNRVRRAFVVIEGHYDRSRAWDLPSRFGIQLFSDIVAIGIMIVFAQQIININIYLVNLLHWHLSFPSAWTHYYSLWDYCHGRRSMTIKGAQNWKWTLPRNNLTFSSKENCETAQAFLRLVEFRLSQPA